MEDVGDYCRTRRYLIRQSANYTQPERDAFPVCNTAAAGGRLSTDFGTRSQPLGTERVPRVPTLLRKKAGTRRVPELNTGVGNNV
jgi:hypothetical protein